MGGWLLREHRIGGASLRCGRPRAVRAAQAEIRKGEILGPGEEGSQISTGQVSAQKWSAAKTDPAQVERTGICSAERFARVQCPAKSRHHYPLRLTVIQRHIAAYMFNSTKQSCMPKWKLQGCFIARAGHAASQIGGGRVERTCYTSPVLFPVFVLTLV